MKIAMIGSGGVGGVFGARLAQAGCEVAFVARGAHLAALRERGLVVESEAHGRRHLPQVRASADPAEIGPVDFAILSVKLWDSEAAIARMRPLVGADTAVLSLQNGVTKDEPLARAFGEKALIGGVAYVSANIASPGVIRQTGSLQRVVLGEFDGRESERVRALRDAFARAGVAAEISPDIRRATWEKFVFLVGLSAATAVMRSPIGPIRANARSRAFLLALMREAVAVGRAQGVALAVDYAEQRLAFADTLPADMTSSMHHDLERGNRLELPWLSGTVVELGQAVDVPTPANAAVCDILALHADGRR